MTTPKDVMKLIKDNDVKYVDLRFTDPRGKWQHVTFDVSMIDEETFAEGQAFDGSSIAGWKAINESDMQLMPDPATACIDPFFAETTLVLVCDVLEPTTGEPYNRDPRGIARRAEAMVKQSGIGDTVYFGPEAEFFVFDDVKFRSDPYNVSFKVDSVELPTNSDTEYEGGNLGHRIRTKGGYFPVPPMDSAQDMRSEMLGAMARMGAKVEKHHHEVASAQHELGLKFAPLTYMADQMQVYKYCIHQVAHIYAKTATFRDLPEDAIAPTVLELEEMRKRPDGERVADVRRELQETMDRNAQVFRTEESLNEALADVRRLKERYSRVSVQDKGTLFNTDLLEAIELGFLLDLAEVVVLGSLNRRESRGGHFREDYPNRNDVDYMQHTMAYRRPVEAGDVDRSVPDDELTHENAFDFVSVHDDYKVVLGAKPVTMTRYEPMERKY